LGQIATLLVTVDPDMPRQPLKTLIFTGLN